MRPLRSSGLPGPSPPFAVSALPGSVRLVTMKKLEDFAVRTDAAAFGATTARRLLFVTLRSASVPHNGT